MKEGRFTPQEAIRTPKSPLEGLQEVVQGEVFSAEPQKPVTPHNVIFHNKNLHGAPGVEGFTGFYGKKGRGRKYYDKGIPRLPKNGR